MNSDEIAGLAEEVQSFVKESMAGIGDQVDARLAEAAELLEKVKESNEALLADGEDRKKELADMADALDFLTDRISELEAVKVADGKDGIDGADGKDGSDGIDGVNGEQGEAGVKGADGIDGRDGAGIDVPIYKAGVYREGSVVQANLGQYFKALKDTAEGVDHESWERVGLSGFRVTGAFDEAKSYAAGDLYIKNFGLFLSDGEESLCVAGRGPAGKRGEKGASGKDGEPGLDGVAGDTFDVLEVRGTNLVAVVKDADGNLSTKSCDLAPLLDVAVDITKSIEAKTESDVKAILESQRKGLLEYISQHINDQEAIPISFFRGLFNTGNTYVRGDAVNFGSALYVTGETTTAIPNSIFEEGNPWKMVVGSGSFGGGGGDGSSGGGGSPITPSYVLTSEAGAHGGLRFSQFSNASGSSIEFVGVEGGANVKATLTTDMVNVNPIPFRNSRNGQYIGTPEELANVKNQRDYNELVYKWLGEIETGDVNLEGYLKELTQEQKIAIIEAQIQYRGLMELDADNKPLWPADQTKDRGGWWAYPTSKNSGWTFNNLKWLFQYRGEVTEDGSTLTSNETKGYQVGDIIQLQIKYNEAGAGTGYKYADVQPVFVEYRVEELHYPDRLSGNSNNDFPVYRVSMNGPAHRYTGRLPNVIKGPEGDPSDAWIQWYPTDFAYGASLTDYATNNKVEYIEGRVDDIEAALPAAESIAPVPTGDLELKITGSRPTGASGEAGKVLMWKAETGSGGSPYNECKILVPDPSVLDLSASELWFKQGSLVQKWNSGGGWLTNGNVLHISATETLGDTLVTGQPVEMYYADPSAVYAPVISVAESKADDRRLQVEIEQLALGLETLLTQRAVGEWRYEGILESGPPREAGTFKAMADMSATENYLALHMEDLNGITHGFGDAEVGDYIELVDIDDPSVYALYVLTAEPPISGTLVELPVKLKDRGADFQLGDKCIIRHFAIGEEDINLTELDDRFVNVTGDSMTGKLKAPIIETDAIDSTSSQGTVYTGAMENGNNLVTNQWVKNQISNTPSQALPTWVLGHFSQGNMQAGKMAFCDGNLNGTDRLEAARGIAFSAVDSNGRRVARDRNAVDYERTYGSVLSVLSGDDTTIMSMARTIGSVAATIYYSAEFDAYMIIWPAEKDLAVTSNITHVVQDQSYQIHCPELLKEYA